MLTRVDTRLTAEEERLVRDVIGCLITVHRALGPGLSETAYSRAACIELAGRSLPFEVEKTIAITYKGCVICHYRIDLLVAGKLVVEIKAVERIHPVHVAQAISYLRATGCPVALVVNFNVRALKEGIRRVVL